MHHKHHKHNPLCRPVIISALWQYIKTHKLQDQHEKEFVNCDPFLKQIFQVKNSKVDFSVLIVGEGSTQIFSSVDYETFIV